MGRWQFNEPRHQPVAGRRAAGFRDACLALLLAGAGCGAPTPSTAAELAGETGTGAALAAEPPDHLVTVTFPSLRRDWRVLKQLPGIAEPLRALPEGVDALSLIVQAQLGPALGSSLLLDRPLAVTVYDRADEVQVVMAGALRKQTLARIRPHFALRRVVDGVLALDQPRQEGALFDDGGACQIHALSGAHYLACAVGERVDSARMRHVVLAAARAKSSDAVVRSAISERTWRRAVKESLDEDWPVFDELDRVLRDEFERFAFDIDGFDVELGGRGERWESRWPSRSVARARWCRAWSWRSGRGWTGCRRCSGDCPGTAW